MKKYVIALTAALILSTALSVGVSAEYTGPGAYDQLEFEVPKVNTKNPKIVIDGIPDLEGEWYGALKSGIDLTSEDAAENYGFWDSTTWGNAYPEPVMSYEDIPEVHRNRWDTYWLWDEKGLYFAVVCETDSTLNPFNPAFYLGGDTGDTKTKRADSFTPMIRPTTDETVAYEWLEFWAETVSGEPFWNDDAVLNYKGNPDNAFEIETASWRASEPNENGAYPYSIEGFIPWDAICYGTGSEKIFDITPESGLVIQIGQIFLDGDGTEDFWGRGFDCPNWAYFNNYLMVAAPAANAPAKSETAETEAPAEDAPDTIAAAQEVQEIDVSNSAETEATKTTEVNTAPQTADFGTSLALLAAATFGAILVSKKKR